MRTAQTGRLPLAVGMPWIMPWVIRFPESRLATMLAGVVFEQRFMWGRAYRKGRVVASRVEVTVVRDARVGPAATRRITARFCEGLAPALRAELERLACVRGVYNRQRIADRLQPIDIVTHDRRHGAHRIAAVLQPLPKPRHDRVEDIEFRIRSVPGGDGARR